MSFDMFSSFAFKTVILRLSETIMPIEDFS